MYYFLKHFYYYLDFLLSQIETTHLEFPMQLQLNKFQIMVKMHHKLHKVFCNTIFVQMFFESFNLFNLSQ
jgi:hypothetical protein